MRLVLHHTLIFKRQDGHIAGWLRARSEINLPFLRTKLVAIQLHTYFSVGRISSITED
jgi:hypothetical protein